jgi:hypothetical protein
MAAREGLQRGEGGRSGLADGQLGAALVSPDQGPGGRGGRRRDRDLQQAPVKPVLRHRLRSQGRLGSGEISMFMVGVTLYLGVEAAVGGLARYSAAAADDSWYGAWCGTCRPVPGG